MSRFGAIMRNINDEVIIDGVNGYTSYVVVTDEDVDISDVSGDNPYVSSVVTTVEDDIFIHTIDATYYCNFAYQIRSGGIAYLWGNESAPGSTNVNLLQFSNVAEALAMKDKYGIVIYDESGNVVFASSNRYMFVKSVQTFEFTQAQAAAAQTKTLTVIDNSNYFLCGPPVYIFDPGDAGNGFVSTYWPMGIKKGGSSTEVYCKAYEALDFSDPDPVHTTWWPNWDKYLIEVQVGN